MFEEDVRKKLKELSESIFSKLNELEKAYLVNVYYQKNKEIKMYKNIIKELELFIKNQKNQNDLDGYMVIYVDEVLNKLKDLKKEV